MSDKQFQKRKVGYTKVDHLTYDVVLPSLSPPAQLVYLRIYRHTVGWGKDCDKISLSQFQNFTGYRSNHTISKAIQELEDRGLIWCVRKQRSVTQYCIIESRSAVLTSMPYDEYLQTPEWKEKRLRMMRYAGYRCQVCNDGGELNVHHRTYERRGHEDYGDLIVLCLGCHVLFYNK